MAGLLSEDGVAHLHRSRRKCWDDTGGEGGRGRGREGNDIGRATVMRSPTLTEKLQKATPSGPRRTRRQEMSSEQTPDYFIGMVYNTVVLLSR